LEIFNAQKSPVEVGYRWMAIALAPSLCLVPTKHKWTVRVRREKEGKKKGETREKQGRNKGETREKQGRNKGKMEGEGGRRGKVDTGCRPYKCMREREEGGGRKEKGGWRGRERDERARAERKQREDEGRSRESTQKNKKRTTSKKGIVVNIGSKKKVIMRI
jgi:hypothetical protein